MTLSKAQREASKPQALSKIFQTNTASSPGNEPALEGVVAELPTPPGMNMGGAAMKTKGYAKGGAAMKTKGSAKGGVRKPSSKKSGLYGR